MKKVYLSLMLLLGLFLSLPAHAEEVVEEIGDLVTDISTIKAGDKLLFFCNGPVDPGDKEYGLRMAYVREGDNNELFISRNLELNSLSSSDFIWTVLSSEPVKDDATGRIIKLQSPRGNNLPCFPYFENKRPKWPGVTVSPEEGEAAPFTIYNAELGDSLYVIMDENGVSFNGQSIAANNTKQESRFVGWNSTSGNSLYKIYRPKLRKSDICKVSMLLVDNLEEERVVEEKGIIGDTIRIPYWENHSFVSAKDLNTEERVSFPFIIQKSEHFLSLTYELWPFVTINCTDEATGEVIFSEKKYIKKGSKFELPSKETIGIGYTLVTEGYEDYEIVEDQTINLVYRKDGKNLPFVATTITDGKFAADTKWYILKVNGSKIMNMDIETGAIYCGTVSSYSDNCQWAFVGDLDNGYKIYNKATGTEQILWAAGDANKTQVFMTDLETAEAPNTFDIKFNGSGYSWKYHGSANAYLNDFGGAGVVKLWAHANAHKGDGSRFVFTEYTPELANAFIFGEFAAYLKSQDCVGGWTADALADLKKAFEAKDTTACRAAVENLATADTIAFDKNKTYALVSAFRKFYAYQPTAVYAMAAEADSSLVWKSFSETDPAFQFGFSVASDSTYYMVSALNKLPIGGFRFGEDASCVEWGDLSVEENKVKEGHPAPFSIVKNTHVPASYFFVHNYGSSHITLCCDPTHNPKSTEGTITTYNTKDGNYNNYWRLVPVGEWSGIADTVVTTPERQRTVIYDLSGRRVSKATKGIYIMNGKKVYIK